MLAGTAAERGVSAFTAHSDDDVVEVSPDLRGGVDTPDLRGGGDNAGLLVDLRGDGDEKEAELVKSLGGRPMKPAPPVASRT